jgi:hypothetical protein
VSLAELAHAAVTVSRSQMGTPRQPLSAHRAASRVEATTSAATTTRTAKHHSLALAHICVVVLAQRVLWPIRGASPLRETSKKAQLSTRALFPATRTSTDQIKTTQGLCKPSITMLRRMGMPQRHHLRQESAKIPERPFCQGSVGGAAVQSKHHRHRHDTNGRLPINGR